MRGLVAMTTVVIAALVLPALPQGRKSVNLAEVVQQLYYISRRSGPTDARYRTLGDNVTVWGDGKTADAALEDLKNQSEVAARALRLVDGIKQFFRLGDPSR